MAGVKMNDKIDIILPWVDGADPVWQTEKEQWYQKLHPEEQSGSDIRFQSWDNLQYWFRAVEKFMPWVNKIFFVTYGHLPEFLNANHPKLRIVRHDEYIPKEYLPTFNSNTIEMNYFRIKDLSENYIIFNDDMIPLQPIEENYYFRNNTICDEAVEGHITPVESGPIGHMARYVQVNNLMIINRYFKKREVQAANWDKWYFEGYGELLERTRTLSYWYDFAGFRDPHMPSSMKKSVLRHLWEIEKQDLDQAFRNKFRAYTDISQYLIRYWQLCEGDFYPRRTLGKMCLVDMDNYIDIAKKIESQEWQMVSLNENCTDKQFELVKKEINLALGKVLKERSSFEQ